MNIYVTDEPLPELRCCPRCGETAAWADSGYDELMVLCDECGYYQETGIMSAETLAGWWNERPYIDKLLARIAELENGE